MKLHLPKTRRFRIYIYLACTLLMLLAIDMVWIRIWRQVILGYDTTHITAPLKLDGTPDYVAYINAQDHAGVTRENNAAIPLIQTLGPPLLPAYREETCKELGIPVPPDSGHTLQPFSEYAKSKIGTSALDLDAIKSLYSEEEFVHANPWAPADHPQVAAWLADYEQPLSHLLEISRHSQLYFPLLPIDRPLEAVLLPNYGLIRAYCHLGLIRAMRRTQEGNFAAARADLLAIHRIARLQCQASNLTSYLVGMAIENSALQADNGFANAPGVPAAEVRQLAADLDALAPLPSIERSFNILRFDTLDALTYAAAHPQAGPHGILGGDSNDISDSDLGARLARFWPAHFNQALRDANTFFDRQLESLKAPTYTAQLEARQRLSHDVDAYSVRHETRFGDPAKYLMVRVMPYAGRIGEIVARNSASRELTRLALALAGYHADHNAYPDSLAALAPTYLPAIPQDLFIDAPLHYAQTPEGYIAYSVGPNQRDDGGFGRTAGGSRDADDIVIRVPDLHPQSSTSIATPSPR